MSSRAAGVKGPHANTIRDAFSLISTSFIRYKGHTEVIEATRLVVCSVEKMVNQTQELYERLLAETRIRKTAAAA